MACGEICHAEEPYPADPSMPAFVLPEALRLRLVGLDNQNICAHFKNQSGRKLYFCQWRFSDD